MRAFLCLLLLLSASALGASVYFSPISVLELSGGVPSAGIFDNSAAAGARAFGGIVLGSGRTVTIRVECGSYGPLILTTPVIASGGPDFSVDTTGFDTSGLGVTQFTDFVVQFEPVSLGSKTGQVTFQFTHSEPGSTPNDTFELNLSGECVASPVPVLDVRRNTAAGLPVYHNHNGFYLWNWMDGSSGGDGPITLFISNAGEAGAPNLLLGTPTINGAAIGEFDLDLSSYNPSLAPGQTTSFTLTHDPVTPGIANGTLTITHNDAYRVSAYSVYIQSWGRVKDSEPDEIPPGCAAAVGPASLPAWLAAPLLLALRRRRAGCASNHWR